MEKVCPLCGLRLGADEAHSCMRDTKVDRVALLQGFVNSLEDRMSFLEERVSVLEEAVANLKKELKKKK